MTRGTTVRAPSVAAEKALPEEPGGAPHRRAVRKELAGPYADVEDLELAVRERDGVRTGFLLHHGEKPLDVPAWAAGTELLTGRRVTAGEVLHLEPTDVLVLREDPS